MRKRFGMHDKQAAQISKLIKDAIDAGKIKPKDMESRFSGVMPVYQVEICSMITRIKELNERFKRIKLSPKM